MKLVLSALIAVLTLAASAAAETRNFSGFTRVKAVDHIAVEVRMGPTYRVEVTGPEADRIATGIDIDGALKVSERNRAWFGPDRGVNALVRVTMPNVTELVGAKGATLTAYDINVERMSLVAAMGAVVNINGQCRALSATAAMGGVLHAQNFHCATLDTTAAMGGDVEVFASDRFDATAAMGGSVRIAGGAHGQTTAAMGGNIEIADGGHADDRTAVMGGSVSER